MKINAMKVGARNNAGDADRLQKIHDLAVENGAACKTENAGKSIAMKEIVSMVGADAMAMQARIEGWDIQHAANVLCVLVDLAASEADEPGDLKSLCDLMRQLVEHIGGEIDEMEQAGTGTLGAGKSTKKYTSDNAPDAIKELPKPAQTIWIAAYNSAHDQSKGDEAKANATAWSAVKEKFKKDKEGTWIAKESKSSIAIPAYVKSLHLSLDEQRFKDVLAVKFIGKNEIRGYSNLWGDPGKVDLETEFFTSKSAPIGATDFWDTVLGTPRPLTWNHAQDGDMFKGSAVVGEIVEFGDDEVGRFYSAVLDRSHKYRDAVSQLISDKSLGTSSDSAPQYVERVKQANGSVWLKTWPLFAAALTDVPCEPRMLDIGSPHWKGMGVDAKLLQTRIAEAGLEVSRDEMAQRVANAQRSFQVLKLYATE